MKIFASINKILIIIIILLISFSQIIPQHFEDKQISIIPTPSELKWLPGQFDISSETALTNTNIAKEAISFMKRNFPQIVDFEPKSNNNFKNKIEFIFDSTQIQLRDGDYTLDVTSKNIVISANDRAGFFYAVQTLLQMLPAYTIGEMDSKQKVISIPCVSIKDNPKYAWRSFMLDSGRQFQSVEFIKRYLNYLAMLKMNVFHWHLTEGQGWRIEIKKYPKLTGIGSNVASGSEQKGFYTQEDIKDIVEYAEKLCITVVPEIDVPGHSEAALIAYPEFSCKKKAPESVMGFSSSLFCGGNEETYTFLENILDEVCELFPGEYIHLGGDEAPKENWDRCFACQKKIKSLNIKNSNELQLYFSSRLAEYLKLKNKKVIFWGDIVEHEEQKLPDNVVIYWWNYRKMKDKAFQNARKIGSKVICGTNYYTYLNYPVAPWSNYKEDRSFDIRDIFEANPSDIENPDSLILGMGTCLWTDWNVKMDMVDQRVFPRILALADQMWSRTNNKNISFSSYYQKIKNFYPRLKIMGINYGPALREEIPIDYKWE